MVNQGEQLAGLEFHVPLHPIFFLVPPLQNLRKQALPYVSCGSTNYTKPKLHSATIMTLCCIMLIAVSSASQFAGVIHWISLVILSVFFSEVCITKVFHHIQNCKVFLYCHWNQQEFYSSLTVNNLVQGILRKKTSKSVLLLLLLSKRKNVIQISTVCQLLRIGKETWKRRYCLTN